MRIYWYSIFARYPYGNCMPKHISKLLPAMQGFTDEMLLEAIQELIEHYNGDETEIKRQLLWMGVMLRRSETIPLEEKEKMQEDFRMYNKYLEEILKFNVSKPRPKHTLELKPKLVPGNEKPRLKLVPGNEKPNLLPRPGWPKPKLNMPNLRLNLPN